MEKVIHNPEVSSIPSSPPEVPEPSLLIEEVKKTKKNEPRIFPFLVMIDREAFSELFEQHTYILKEFWRSHQNRICVARKPKTKSIVGYACYLDGNEKGHGYLMRIGVRIKCQR